MRDRRQRGIRQARGAALIAGAIAALLLPLVADASAAPFGRGGSSGIGRGDGLSGGSYAPFGVGPSLEPSMPQSRMVRGRIKYAQFLGKGKAPVPIAAPTSGSPSTGSPSTGPSTGSPSFTGPALTPRSAARSSKPSSKSAQRSPQSSQAALRSIDPPPAGETRFVADHIICVLRDGMSETQINGFLRDNGLARTQSGRKRISLIGASVFRFRITDGLDVSTKITALGNDRRVLILQPNYFYELTQTPAPQPAAPSSAAPSAVPSSAPAQGTADSGPAQYVVSKLQLQQAHRVTSGDRVLIAIIDSAIDTTHAELSGRIAKQIDVLEDADRNPHAHGTAMAGAIVARAQLRGVAPAARVIAVRAFSASSVAGASGTSFHLAQAISRAIEAGARVVNLSFAGPLDPLLQRTVEAARKRGVVLVAAAGNAGPRAAPLYPAAYADVIAVTATDANDKIYGEANRGKYIAVAAPGVDVLVPAPRGAYGVSTGTSVAAAHVSGVVALLLARNPALDPDAIRQILVRSAHALGATAPDDVYGAGITNAYRAIMSLDPGIAVPTQ